MINSTQPAWFSNQEHWIRKTLFQQYVLLLHFKGQKGEGFDSDIQSRENQIQGTVLSIINFKAKWCTYDKIQNKAHNFINRGVCLLFLTSRSSAYCITVHTTNALGPKLFILVNGSFRQEKTSKQAFKIKPIGRRGDSQPSHCGWWVI